MAPGTRCLPVGRYPPVAVRVLVGDRAAPGVVHPAGTPAAAAAPAAAPAAGHLVAQVRTGLGAGHAAQRIDPRVGASVAAHVGGHSESRSARRHKQGRAGSEKVEGFKGKAPNLEPGRARRWVAGTILATRAVPAAASAARRAEVGRGGDVGRGAGAAGRAVARRAARAQRSWLAAGCWCWSVGARVSSPLAPGAQATPGGFLPRAGCGRRASPPPAGVTDALGPPLPTCARRPAAPPCASEAGGTPAGAGSPRPERPGCGDLREGVRWRGPLAQRFGCDRGESAAPAFQDFLGPRGGNKPKNKGLSIGRLLIKHLLLLTPGNGASQALNRNIIEKSMLRW